MIVFQNCNHYLPSTWKPLCACEEIMGPKVNFQSLHSIGAELSSMLCTYLLVFPSCSIL